MAHATATARVIEGPAVEVLFAHSCELGEGALWCGADIGGLLANRLLHIDVYGPSKLAPGPAVFVSDVYASPPSTVAYDLPSPVGTVVPEAGGAAVLVALADGVHRLDLATRALTRLAAPGPEHGPGMRFNDGKASPEGHFFVGTMKAAGPRAGEGSLYVLRGGGGGGGGAALERVREGVDISNGIAWGAPLAGDARRRTMFYIDTPRDDVLAYDYDGAAGAVSNARVAFAIPPGAPAEAAAQPACNCCVGAPAGHPDGCAMDAAGALWVAQWGGARVVAYDAAARGAVLATVRLPTSHVSSVAFTGPGLSDLVFTTAKEHMDGATRAAQPRAGDTFIVRGVGAVGVAGCAWRPPA